MDFKKVSELTAVAIPFLLVCSSVYLVTYYSHWNIPIFEYLSTAEILFLFIWPVLTIILLAGGYILACMVFVAVFMAAFLRLRRFRPAKRDSDEKREVVKKPPDLVRRLLEYFVFAGGVIGIGLLFVQGVWLDYGIIPAVIVHVLIWIFVLVGVNKIVSLMEIEPGLETHFAALMITLLSASFFYGRYQAHYAVTQPALQTVVLTDGSSFATDASVVYLGKTSGFYFYYKTAEKETLILPAAQIKSVSIKPSN